MKKFKLVLMLVALTAMIFVLAGCPKKGMRGRSSSGYGLNLLLRAHSPSLAVHEKQGFGYPLPATGSSNQFG